jgi:hypothetical protein
MKSILLRLLFLTITLSLLQSCYSVQTVVSQADSLEQGQVSIMNQTSEKLMVYIGEEALELFPVEIDPEETWISHEFRLRPRIRIYDGEKYEEYILTPGKPYQLYLDPKKNRPDIKMIRTR